MGIMKFKEKQKKTLDRCFDEPTWIVTKDGLDKLMQSVIDETVEYCKLNGFEY